MKTQAIKFFDKRKVLWTMSGVIGIVIISFLTMSARAASSAVITSAVYDSSQTAITSASIGTMVHSTVVLATSTEADPLPTGTVDFNRYPSPACSGIATTEADVMLILGVASSTSIAMPNTGLSYKVHYDGQTDVYPPSDSDCKSVIATASSTILTTTLSTTTAVFAGSIVHDSATLSNATSNALGTVVYTVYSNNVCTLGAISAGTGTVTNSIVSDSSSLQFNIPGTYYFQAVYSGDVHNVIATSTCGSEVLTVIATTTPPGRIIVDKVTLPASDSTSFQFNTTGSGYTSFTLTDLAIPNDQTLVPGVYTISEASISGWSLTSSVCSVNGLATSTYVLGANLTLNSGDTIKCIFTNTKQIVSGAGMIGGKVYEDLNLNLAKDAGEPGLSGWTINLYKGAGWWGQNGNNPVFMTAVSDGSGNYSFNNLVDGTYSVEEIKKSGWKQKTSDYNSIIIINGGSKLDADFGNASTTNKHGKGNGFIDHCKEFFKKFKKHEDNGKHKGQIKNGNNGRHEDKNDRDNDRDDDENDD